MGGAELGRAYIVNTQLFRVAGYRFRATFARRWGGYLTIVLLVGLLGGLAMGAVAGARRTQASSSTYLASTNPSDLVAFTAFDNPALGSANGYSAAAVAEVAHLPYVRHQATVVGFDGNLDTVTGVHVRIPAGENRRSWKGASTANTRPRIGSRSCAVASPTRARWARRS